MDDSGIDVVECWLVIWRYKWLILALWLVTSVTAYVVTLRMPKTYESTVTLLAPREGGSSMLSSVAASGLLQQLPGLSVPSLTPSRDIIMGILRSRRVAAALVRTFGLQQRYQTQFFEDAIDRLQKATDVSASREGIIVVKTRATEPVLAAQLANAYVEELDRLAAEFGSSEAGRQRAFISQQLLGAKRSLEAAEEALRRFQERNRAIVLQEQTRGAIEAAAKLKGEVMASEVQLQVMRNFATENNPEVIALKRRVDEMKRQLAQMQYGDDAVGGGRGSVRRDIYVPFSRVPEVGLALARETREVKVQETLVTLLVQQLEQAKIAEAKDMPLVQVLDRAVPPVRHSSPSKRWNVSVAGGLSLVVGVLFALLRRYITALRSLTLRRVVVSSDRRAP